MAESSDDHVYLVDGSGFIFRAFHALPPMNRADGTPTNAVFGFTNMLMKLIEDMSANHLAVIFDTSRQTFRSEIYPQYKAHRPPPPEELIPQFALVREAVAAFNVVAVDLPGFEADDLIAAYARAARIAGQQVTIVSSDKDLMQLVGDGVDMLDPMKNRLIGPAEVVDRFGVGPERVVDVQALAGDSVDNVPGVPGIGIKTAAQLINEYGDLEALLAHAAEIKQPKRRQTLLDNAEMARISKQLVKLRDDIDLPVPLVDLAVALPDDDALLDFFKAQSFKRLIARQEAEMANAGGDGASHGDNQELAPVESGYELVQDLPTLRAWIARARHLGVIAVDTETSSLNAMRAELIGVSLATMAGQACYIPLRHRSGGQGDLEFGDQNVDAGPLQISFEAAMAELRPLLEDAAVLKVGHNIKYDALVLSRPVNGAVQISPVDDTMCLSYVLEGGAHGHGLDELSLLHVDHRNIKFADVCGKGKAQIPFAEVALESALDYAAEDADMTGRLHRLLKPRVGRDHLMTVYETLERPLIPVLVAMEQAGIKVDPLTLSAMSQDFAKRIADLEAQIHAMAGEVFNVGSPKQLGEILFDKMSLPGGKKGKTGAYATGADILEELAAQGHDLPARVIDYRQLSKLKSTYTDALVADINPETGRIHTSYSMAAASTGRLSSNDPNLQNIPIRTEEGRKIRTAFVAPDGFRLLSVDYSQIELRLVADIAGLDSMRQAFLDGVDIHAQTASEVFGVPLAAMDSETRRKAKAINFGIIYGISGFGLARQLGVPQSEARDYIDTYFKRYPGIREYMEEIKAFCRQHGYVETRFGRRVHIPGIKDANPARRAFSERAAINAPIQGTAADIIKRAMIRMPPKLAAAGLQARMLLQVHDELLFEVPENQLDDTSAVVREVMETAGHPVLALSVPLIAEAGVGSNWAEAH